MNYSYKLIIYGCFIPRVITDLILGHNGTPYIKNENQFDAVVRVPSYKLGGIQSYRRNETKWVTLGPSHSLTSKKEARINKILLNKNRKRKGVLCCSGIIYQNNKGIF